MTANNVTWEYTVPAVSQEWLSVTQQGTTLTVSVSDNQLAEERIGQIRIDATDNSKLPARSVTVRQEANPEPPQVSLSVEPASLTFPAEGAVPQQVTVTAEPESMEWRAESDDDAQGWVTLTQEKGQLTVAVSDNPETRRRTGKVVVTPQHTAASPKAIVIVQEAKVLPPSLSADTEGPIAWEYDNDTGTVINIAAVNVQWSAKAVDDDGSTLPWLSVYQAEDYINAVPQRNTDSAPRSGFIVITADREEVAELRIPVSQSGAPDHLYPDRRPRPHDAGLRPRLLHADAVCTRRHHDSRKHMGHQYTDRRSDALHGRYRRFGTPAPLHARHGTNRDERRRHVHPPPTGNTKSFPHRSIPMGAEFTKLRGLSNRARREKRYGRNTWDSGIRNIRKTPSRPRHR